VSNDNKEDLLINDGTKEDPREERADNFAADLLIPPNYNNMIRLIHSKNDVIAMARNLEISAGIVAGRYQHLTKNWRNFRGLIQNFEWATE